MPCLTTCSCCASPKLFFHGRTSVWMRASPDPPRTLSNTQLEPSRRHPHFLFYNTGTAHTSTMATVGVSRMRYFNLRSRAELVRLVYAYGRLPLEEEAVPLGREYLSIKPTLLFGQLPEMDIDGKRYAQSIALARYAAKHVGLYPLDDHRKALEVDMIVDTARDILAPIASNVFLERDAERRTKAINKLNKYELPGFLGGMESQLSSGAKDSEPFFLGTQVSLADLAVFDVIDNMLVPEKDIFPIDFEAQYPGLVNVVEHVKKIPAIEEYLATRPDRSNKPIF